MHVARQVEQKLKNRRHPGGSLRGETIEQSVHSKDADGGRGRSSTPWPEVRARKEDSYQQRWYPLGLTDAVTGGACEVDWLTDAVAGGACEVDWTWLSASVRGRGPFLFVDEYLFAFIHWPFKVSKTVTRP
jgi:hypothetical protein